MYFFHLVEKLSLAYHHGLLNLFRVKGFKLFTSLLFLAVGAAAFQQDLGGVAFVGVLVYAGCLVPVTEWDWVRCDIQIIICLIIWYRCQVFELIHRIVAGFTVLWAWCQMTTEEMWAKVLVVFFAQVAISVVRFIIIHGDRLHFEAYFGTLWLWRSKFTNFLGDYLGVADRCRWRLCRLAMTLDIRSRCCWLLCFLLLERTCFTCFNSSFKLNCSHSF